MSVHQDGSQLSQDIWDGNYWGSNGAVARQREDYKKSQGLHETVSLMSTLYSALARVLPSARHLNPIALARVRSCISQLKPLVAWAYAQEQSRFFGDIPADQCEVISHVLLRWSDLPFSGGLRLLPAAERYAEAAYSRRSDTKHTKPLACLTLAGIYLRRKDSKSLEVAQDCLQRAEDYLPAITDDNQRSRVCRGIAELIIGICGRTENAKAKAREMLCQADLSARGADVKAKNDAMRHKLKL